MDTANTENYLPEDESKDKLYQDYYLQMLVNSLDVRHGILSWLAGSVKVGVTGILYYLQQQMGLS